MANSSFVSPTVISSPSVNPVPTSTYGQYPSFTSSPSSFSGTVSPTTYIASPSYTPSAYTSTIQATISRPKGQLFPASYEIIPDDDRLIKSIPLAPGRNTMTLKPIELQSMGVPISSLIYNLYSDTDNEFSVGIAFCSMNTMRSYTQMKGLSIVSTEQTGVYQNQLSNIENHRYLTCAMTGSLLPSIYSPEHDLTTISARVSIYRLTHDAKFCLGVIIS